MKSVIDYILVSEEHEGYIERMIIDEEKESTPYRDDSTPGNMVFTDHNMITLELNLQVKR